MTRNIKEIERLKKSKDFVFLIGNGINRYYDEKAGIKGSSWEELLQETINAQKIQMNIFADGKGNTQRIDGISNPEIFSLSECGCDGEDKKNIHQLQCDFVKNLGTKMPNENKLDGVYEKLLSIGRPVLTTNFDLRMHEGKIFTMKGTDGKCLNSYYPLYRYFAEHEVSDACNDFAIWHIHGAASTPSRIQISLDNYVGYINRIRQVLPDLSDTNKDDKKREAAAKTWVYAFMTKPLLIVGLGLDIDETMLRWLLIKRKRRNWMEGSSKSIYAYVDDKEMNQGKELFLKQVGIEPLQFKDYDEMYQTIFETN